MVCLSTLPGSRLSRAVRRGLAALALVLSIVAPLHGAFHEHGHDPGDAEAGIEAASHAHAKFESACPFCTLSSAPALLGESAAAPSLAPQFVSPMPRAPALASRQGAAAPARGPPAPTC